MYSLLLLYCLKSTFVTVASAEKASGGNSDGYCGRILGVQTQGTRRDGHHEFRLRMEGDPTTYEPGSTYRGRRWLIQNFLSQAFTTNKQNPCKEIILYPFNLDLIFFQLKKGQMLSDQTEGNLSLQCRSLGFHPTFEVQNKIAADDV